MRFVVFAAALAVLLLSSPALAYGPRGGTVCVPGAPTGTVYYVCDCGTGAQPGCTVGNDASATPTNPATPLRTFDAARTKFTSMSNGDRVELCQGGVFPETSGNNGFDNGNFTVVGGGGYLMSYVAAWGGGGVKPKILPVVTEDAIQLIRGSTPAHGAYTFADFEIAGQGTSASSGTNVGIFVFGNESNVTACNLNIHDMQIGMQVSRNVETDRNLNSTMTDSIVKDCWGQGWLGGDSGTSVLYSQFKNDGFARALLNHGLYLVGANGTDNTQTSTGWLIKGNEVYQTTFISGSGCSAAEITMHGLSANIVVDGNYVHEDIGTIDPGCWGIALAPGYTATETLTNVTVKNNIVENVGNASIVAGSWVGGLIENNVLINRQGNTDKAIDIPDNEGVEDTPTTGVIVRNNSILIDAGIGIRLGTEGTGYGVINNAIYHTGGGTPGCFTLNLAAAAYGGGVDYNDCWIVGGVGSRWETSTGDTLSAWRSATGFETHGFSTDPAYLAMTSPYNLAFLNTSPLYNAGSTALGSSTDILGVTRPQGAATDIGAYELLVGIPTPAAPGRNRPIAYGGWFLLMLFVLAVGACAGALSVKRRRAELSEGEPVHLIDEHTTLALEEMRRDGIGLAVNEQCEVCVRRMFARQEKKG